MTSHRFACRRLIAVVFCLFAFPLVALAAGPADVKVDAELANIILKVESVVPSVIANGAESVFTVRIHNGGSVAATNVGMTVTLPSNVEFVSSSPAVCSGTSTVVCNFPDLQNGRSHFVGLTVRAVGTGIATLHFVGTASNDDPSDNNNTASASVTILPAADLSVTISGAPDPVAQSMTLTYTISVTNNGPEDANDVIVDLTPDPSLSFVSSGGDCVTALPCAFGTLISGESRTFTSTWTVAPGTSGSISSTATAATASADSNSENDEATETTEVVAGTDLRISKTGPSVAVPEVTPQISYQITVMNDGVIDAHDVVVADPTPAGLALAGVTGACATLPCSLGTLSRGATASLTVTYDIVATTGTTVTNIASVSGSVPDPDPTNDTASVETLISACPGFEISGPTTVCPGGSITLSAPAGFVSYLWSTGATTSSITVSQTEATTYSVSITDQNGCTVSDTHHVSITPVSFAISGPEDVCEGASVTLSAPAGFASYLWSTGATTQSITVSPLQATTYTVSAVGTDGCLASDSHTVTVTSINTSIGAAGSYAPSATGQVASVQAQAGATYAWTIFNGSITGGQGTSSISFNAGASGSVDIRVTITRNGCQETGRHVATIDAPPPGCPTTAPSLISPLEAANVSSPVTFAWTAVPEATSYELWYDNAMVGTTSVASMTVPLPSGGGSWYVIARAQTGCPGLVSNVRHVQIPQASTCHLNAAPQLTSPTSGASVGSPTTFTWSAAPNAIGYRVWVEMDGTAAQDVGGTSGALSLTVVLAEGSFTAWVEALYSGCTGVASPPVGFGVAGPEPCSHRRIAQLLVPAGGATIQSSFVDFRWAEAAGASGYRVWASIDGQTPVILGITPDTQYTARIESGVVVWWVESLYDGCASTESQPRTLTIPPAGECPAQTAALVTPAGGASVSGNDVTFQWSSVPNAIAYELWVAYASGTPTLMATTAAGVTSKTLTLPDGEFSWFVRTAFNRCPTTESAHRHFNYQRPEACAGNQRAILSSPVSGSRFSGNVHFGWSAVEGATGYVVYASRNSGAFVPVASSATSNALVTNLATGVYRWFVRTSFGAGCSPLDSAEQHFELIAEPAACSPLVAPVISAPGQISAGIPFQVLWSPIAGATNYQLQIASNATFSGAQLIATNATQHTMTLQNQGDTVSTTYLRVRALDHRCSPAALSLFGPTAAVGILPPGDEASVPAGWGGSFVFPLDLGPELSGQTFTTSVSQPWLSVSPAAGVVPPGGITLSVTADTSGLAPGTSLGGVSVTVTSSDASRRIASNGTTVIPNSFSMTLVTPVSATPNSTPPPDALIIPAIAHATGINAVFQSDVRVANTSPQLMTYQLAFIPSGEAGISVGQRTTFSVEPGRTIALDNILRTWFGGGSSNTTGVLEIRPQVPTSNSISSAPVGGLAKIVSFAASRTFNATSNGTFGQYVPAIPYANFLGQSGHGAASNILSLQQIAQSNRYRTNLGLLESSGHPASLLVKIFGLGGQQIGQFTTSLKGGQHTQLNAFLATNGIESLDDGRVEISIASGSGKVTAYASVLDNQTSDPLLVTPINVNSVGGTKWVVPGVADFDGGNASWRSDLRLFNAGTSNLETTLTYFSLGGGAGKSTTVTVPAGDVLQLDRVVTSVFNAVNDGGAVHITTAEPARLVTTARTYNETSQGTYGQFLAAVAAQDAAGVGSRPLQLLQVEESSRFRTNVGLAEVSGKPVTLEITVVPPDAKFAAVTQLTLAPNEFRQLGSLLKSVGLDGTHNARITVSAVGGEGRITAYASVIDMVTNDPTYVPAQ